MNIYIYPMMPIHAIYFFIFSPFIRIKADLEAELDVGIETEREFKTARATGRTPKEDAREFQNANWRNPVTPNQLISTEICLEMNDETKKEIMESNRRPQNEDLDNRLAPKTHLHIIVFNHYCFYIILLSHIYV